MNPDSFRNPHLGEDLPIAVSPTGRRIGPGGFLPTLPCPERIVVGTDALWVDGWVFRLNPISKQTTHWLMNQVNTWCRNDPSKQNRAQILGVLDAVEEIVKKD